MTAQVSPPSRASDILAAAGVAEDFSFYRGFTAEAEKAVLTVPQKIVAAWAANDADAFADVFTADGSLLMQDEQLVSRDEIRAHMAAGFDGPYAGARVTGFPLSVEFLSEDVAMVVTEGGILLAGDEDLDAKRAIRATWIIVERDGEWRLLSHQSSPIAG
ncbi:SgcJ/EcaC family oxidoreductase [Amycolatopsis sp. NPDC098790]|uniref:SgcJ/EcaC family oxidoreductase n=1 Tax=Amycolatopsis sp. NPDC098790 TaxID=3363939 RepID=UPI0037FD32FE